MGGCRIQRGLFGMGGCRIRRGLLVMGGCRIRRGLLVMGVYSSDIVFHYILDPLVLVVHLVKS